MQKENVTIQQKIGNRIALLRLEKNLTQKELAKELQISREKLAKMETGEKDFKTKDIIKICDFFSCDCDYLMRGVKCKSGYLEDELGLSAKSVSQIMYLNKLRPFCNIFERAFEALEKILEEENGYKILYCIGAYLEMSGNSQFTAQTINSIIQSQQN